MPGVLVGRRRGRRRARRVRRPQRPFDLGLDRQQRTEPLHHRPDRGDVGSTDEPHGRSTSAPIANEANIGASANRRALITISAPARFGMCSAPPTAVSQRTWLADQTRLTKPLSRPQSSTSLAVHARIVRTDDVASPAAWCPTDAGRQGDHVGELLGRVRPSRHRSSRPGCGRRSATGRAGRSRRSSWSSGRSRAPRRPVRCRRVGRGAASRGRGRARVRPRGRQRCGRSPTGGRRRDRDPVATADRLVGRDRARRDDVERLVEALPARRRRTPRRRRAGGPRRTADRRAR